MKPNCLLCGQKTKRKSAQFCTRSCSSKYRAKDIILIPKESLIQDYIITQMTWADICSKYKVSLLTLKRYLAKYEIQYRTDFDFVGKHIGKLTVLEKAYSKNTKRYWKCKCDCGNEYYTTSGILSKSKTICCEQCRGLERREADVIKTTFWNHYIDGAKRRNLDFTITKEYAHKIYISQNGKCALSGVDISFSPSQGLKLRKQTTASLDRIDSSKGYIEDNIQWVHKRVNRLKMDMTEDEFLNWCNLISKYRCNNDSKIL